MYNLEVLRTHNFHVGESSLLVHNAFKISYLEQLQAKWKTSKDFFPDVADIPSDARTVLNMSESQWGMFKAEIADGSRNAHHESWCARKGYQMVKKDKNVHFERVGLTNERIIAAFSQ